MLLLSITALVVITLLQQSAAHGRDAQLELANLRSALTQLQTAPFQSSARTGGSAAVGATLMRDGKRQVAEALASLRRTAPEPSLADVDEPLRTNFAALDAIAAIGAAGTGFSLRAAALVGVAVQSLAEVEVALDAASREYDSAAHAADIRATAGSIATVLLLALAFVLIYRRSARARSVAEALAVENERLAEVNRREARTDALTGLGNRRALLGDLEAELPRTDAGRPLALALFDLDGFKQYNDTFGHPAGDALLARLGERLRAAVGATGTTYRMGGDEFCVLARIAPDEGEALLRIAAEALTETGDAFTIGCSQGIALGLSAGTTSADALRMADQRMYAQKAGRSSSSRQSSDVLLKVLSERSLALQAHLSGVADLAALTAERLGLSGDELWRVGLAAELHDVGKTAIPDAILDKPAPLDDAERTFMRRHTIIGERVMLAAPALAQTAELVRSSHERFDGTGYPDGLAGEAIPLGGRIIAVCDAFDVMVTGRPYRSAISADEALAELRRSAGTHLDPRVVEAFCELAGEHIVVIA